MKRAMLLIGALCCVSVSQALAPDKQTHHFDKRSIDLNNAHGLAMETRLENIVEPKAYRLDIEPYLEDGVFKGRVEINVTWLVESDEIALHAAHELEITDVDISVTQGSGKPEAQVIKRASTDPKKPIYTIRLEKPVPKGAVGNLTICFNGNLETASTEAFFKTTFASESESESLVAATHLRPNNARRMFPCFDEPAFKTPFEISAVRPRGMVALSNTPVARTEEIPGEEAVRDYFERTPPMSTFTVGLVIADIKVLDNSTHIYKDDNGNNIALRVWGREEFLPAMEGVMTKITRVLTEIANFWKVPLPLQKLDIVALPNYHGVKPADNWGLIVFKESDLSSRGYLQLAQEVSYQWLGALTTPTWWTDAHLNKALVGYLAAEIAFKINNGSEMEGKWPMTVLYSLYYEYSKRYPHSRITGMKQETACTKIELIFRMFNYTLGPEVFKKGLRMFIEERKFKTFSGEDIWKSLDVAAVASGRLPRGVSVAQVAASWTDRDRLPLLTVHRDLEKNSASVSQRMFLRERPHDVPKMDEMLWLMPLVVTTGDHLDFTNTTPSMWLMGKQGVLKNVPGPNEILIVNPEEIAPFPVNYDEVNWNLLIKYLRSENRTRIPELTRAKLLHDAWNLAFAGELKFSTALDMTLFLKDERHHLVWDPVFTMIDHIGRHLCECLHPKFQAYVRSLLSPLYEELLKNIREDEESWKKNLRSITKTFLCKAGYKPCVKEAQEQFAKWMKAKNPDEGNPISNQFICPVFKWGTKEEWEFGLRRVLNFPLSRKQSERTYLLKTLAGCPTDNTKVMRLLNITILEGNGNFTETDIFLIFSMLTGAPEGYSTLYRFLFDQWDVLKQKFSSKANIWDNLISAATSHFTTRDGLEMITELYNAHKGEFGSAEHIIEKSIRVVKEEAKWSDENQPVINKWLDQYLSTNKVSANGKIVS